MTDLETEVVLTAGGSLDADVALDAAAWAPSWLPIDTARIADALLLAHRDAEAEARGRLKAEKGWERAALVIARYWQAQEAEFCKVLWLILAEPYGCPVTAASCAIPTSSTTRIAGLRWRAGSWTLARSKRDD